jgi:hypothetical protein
VVLLQARRERKRGFQVPGGVAEVIVGELENEYVVCGVFLFVCVCISLSVCPPAAGGFAPPFIDQGGGGLHARRAIQLCGEVRRAML